MLRARSISNVECSKELPSVANLGPVNTKHTPCRNSKPTKGFSSHADFISTARSGPRKLLSSRLCFRYCCTRNAVPGARLDVYGRSGFISRCLKPRSSERPSENWRQETESAIRQQEAWLNRSYRACLMTYLWLFAAPKLRRIVV